MLATITRAPSTHSHLCKSKCCAGPLRSLRQPGDRRRRQRRQQSHSDRSRRRREYRGLRNDFRQQCRTRRRPPGRLSRWELGRPCRVLDLPRALLRLHRRLSHRQYARCGRNFPSRRYGRVQRIILPSERRHLLGLRSASALARFRCWNGPCSYRRASRLRARHARQSGQRGAHSAFPFRWRAVLRKHARGVAGQGAARRPAGQDRSARDRRRPATPPSMPRPSFMSIAETKGTWISR